MSAQKRTRLRHKAKVSLVEFMRPGAYWPQPYSLETAFQTLRCLMVSGLGYSTKHYWHTTSITSLLGGYSKDHSYPKPITSLKDLKQRFHAAIFANGSPEIEKWRTEKGINAYAELDLEFLHYKPFAPVPHLGFNCEIDIRTALNSLFVEAPGKSTSVSLNSVHRSATIIHGIDVTMYPEGFGFTLLYGFHAPDKRPPDGDSEWGYCLASTQKAAGSNGDKEEPFLDTLRRALDRFAFIMDPANAHLTTTLDNKTFVPKETAPELD